MANQNLQLSSPTRDQMLQYAEAVNIQKMPKKTAYISYINNEIKDPYSAIVRLEKNQEYQAILESIMGDDNVLLNKKIAKVRVKYVDLIEKNIDTMQGVIKKAVEEGELKDQAMAVRLANETISALQIVDGPRDGGQGPGKLNKSGVIG